MTKNNSNTKRGKKITLEILEGKTLSDLKEFGDFRTHSSEGKDMLETFKNIKNSLKLAYKLGIKHGKDGRRKNEI